MIWSVGANALKWRTLAEIALKWLSFPDSLSLSDNTFIIHPLTLSDTETTKKRNAIN